MQQAIESGSEVVFTMCPESVAKHCSTMQSILHGKAMHSFATFNHPALKRTIVRHCRPMRHRLDFSAALFSPKSSLARHST
ncbi:MAG: hypothetical protein J0M09_10165 [Xanthomonadales bacterium]|jgi:hypothetical protein|nr:hypothetical protein [Xanthomonadales bacterium]